MAAAVADLSASDQLPPDRQANYLSDQMEELQLAADTLENDTGRSIIQRVAGFIRVFLNYVFSLVAMVTQLQATSTQTTNDMAELGRQMGDLDNNYNLHDAAITQLEAIKMNEFKQEVMTHFAQLEARLGGGGQTIIDEVRASTA